MNFPRIWKFLTPLILGMLLPESGWIPVLFMGVASTYASPASVLGGLCLWVFSALSTQTEIPTRPWKTACQVRVEITEASGKSSNNRCSALVLQGNLSPGMHVLLKLPKKGGQQLQEGEQWWVRGLAELPGEPRNPTRFSEARYLKSKGLDAVIQVGSSGLFCFQQVSAERAVPKSLAQVWAQKIQQHSPSAPSGFLVRALLLGDKSGLTQSMKSWFRRTGLSHLLAVSGLHVAILFAGLNLILLVFPGKLTWLTGVKAVFLSLALLGYSYLTGFSPSVLRASLMLGFAQWFLVLRRKPNGIQNLGLAVFFLLALDPKMAFNAGFQLSVLAVAGILIIEPMLSKYKPKQVPPWLWSGLAVSLSAQISTAPLMLSWNGQFPTWFLLTNLLAIPLTTLYMYLSVVWFIGVLVFDSHPQIDVGFSWCGTHYLKAIEWMGTWPASELLVPKPDTMELVFAYGLLISLLWKLASKSLWPYYWISLLIFAGWTWQKQQQGLAQHLYFQAKQGPPTLFLWNGYRLGASLEIPVDKMPLNVIFKGKTYTITQSPLTLDVVQNADAVLWLDRKRPPWDWVHALPEAPPKYSLQAFPASGWKSLADSTDLVLY